MGVLVVVHPGCHLIVVAKRRLDLILSFGTWQGPAIRSYREILEGTEDLKSISVEAFQSFHFEREPQGDFILLHPPCLHLRNHRLGRAAAAQVVGFLVIAAVGLRCLEYFHSGDNQKLCWRH